MYGSGSPSYGPLVTTRAHPKAVEAVERAVARASSAEEVFLAAGDALREAVPFDGSMWFGVDPGTLLATAPAVMEGLDSGYCDVFWHREFHEHDASLFRDLVRSAEPAAALRQVTADSPGRSGRYREFLAPQGYDDELRVVFRSGDSPWAMAALLRAEGRPAFDAADVAVVTAVSAVVGAALRTHAVLAATGPTGPEAPGLLLFDEHGRLRSANAEAARWVGDVFGAAPDPDAGWVQFLAQPADDLRIPTPLTSLLSHARAVAAGHEPGPARLRVRDRSGRWLVLHASCLAAPGSTGDVAVVIEPAKSAEIAPIIIEAYGLTARERDVVRAIARGSSTPEIASELYLSPHTVRDYVKTVFEKVGVSSRGELVAKLFAEHYTDSFHAAAIHV